MKKLAYLVSLGLSILILSSCALSLTTTPLNTGRINTSVTSTSFSKEDCKKGGWQSLRTLEGQSFKNQGDCVSYSSR